MQRLARFAIAGTLACSAAHTAGSPDAPMVAVDSVRHTVVEHRIMSYEEIAALQHGGTPVDTIVVEPSRVHLRIGESYATRTFRIAARDTAGRIVSGFVPAFINGSHGIVRFGANGLEARAAGTGAVYVEALPRDPGQDPTPHRPSTRIEFVVDP